MSGFVECLVKVELLRDFHVMIELSYNKVYILMTL